MTLKEREEWNEKEKTGMKEKEDCSLKTDQAGQCVLTASTLVLM